MGAQWKQKGREQGAAAKGRLFTKLAKEIMVAAKAGPDPAMNPRLRLAVEQAKKASMTRDTLERAIKKGAGLLDEEVQLRARHLRRLRAAPRAGDRRVPDRQQEPHRAQHARAVPQGSARRERQRVVGLQALRRDRGRRPPSADADAEEAAIEAGAQDLEAGDDGADALSAPSRPISTPSAARSPAAAGPCTARRSVYIAKNPVKLDDAARAEVEAFLEALDEDDDVQNIFVGFAE